MLKQRLCYGLPLAALFAAAMAFLPGPGLFVMLISFSMVCQWEFYQLAARGGYRVYARMGSLMGVGWMFCVYRLAGTPANPDPILKGWEAAMLAAICFLILLRTMFDKKVKQAFETSAITILGIIYAPVMLSYYLRLAQWEAAPPLHWWSTTRAGVFLCFFLSLVVKLSDTGAYVAGVNFGKRKLFPRISPAKSWEGVFGAIIAGVLIGLLAGRIAVRYHWGPQGIFWNEPGELVALTPPRLALVSFLLVVVGSLGDLIESMLKRAVNIKDSGGVFPGIGGILDVIDSLIFAPPLLYFFLCWSLV